MKVNVYKYNILHSLTLIREGAEMTTEQIRKLLGTPNLVLKTLDGECITRKSLEKLEESESGEDPLFGWAEVNSANKPTKVFVGVDTEGICRYISSGHSSEINNGSIETVEFSDKLNVIPAEAFKDCANITSITIPKNIKEIGEDAFSGTSLADITFEGIPETLAHPIAQVDTAVDVYWPGTEKPEDAEEIFAADSVTWHLAGEE